MKSFSEAIFFTYGELIEINFLIFLSKKKNYLKIFV